MNLTINGDNRIVSKVETLGALVDQLGMKSDRVAIELNREIVPRDQWPQTPLKDGDRLEIVHFVGGGSTHTQKIWLEKSRMKNGASKNLRVAPSVIAALIAIAIPALAQTPHHFEPGFNLFSKQQDMQLGQESSAEVHKQMSVIQDPVLTDHVNRVGQQLVAARSAGDRISLHV
jgi:sulfur carrier protein